MSITMYGQSREMARSEEVQALMDFVIVTSCQVRYSVLHFSPGSVC